MRWCLGFCPRDSSLMPQAKTTPGSPGLESIDPLSHIEWDSFLMSHPDYSFFHGSAWARVLRDVYCHKPFYLVVRNESRLLGLSAVMEVNSWLTGRRGVSLPFTDECEPLLSDGLSRENLFNKTLEFGKGRRWRYFECRGGRRVIDGIPASLAFYKHTLQLSSDEERLLGTFKSGVRRAIRKAQSAGLQIEITHGLEGVRTFYSLHCQTRKRHGLPPQSFRFFRSVFQHIISRDMGFVAIARHRQGPISAAVFFKLGAKAIFKYGASDLAFQHLRGNNFVMWEAIKWLARRGFRSVHLGRTSLHNQGLRQFKSGFGADEQRVEYFKYHFRRGGFVTDQDRSVGWFNRIFHLMPTPLARMMGALMYRHLA